MPPVRWLRIFDGEMTHHIVPFQDIALHTWDDCWCGPRITGGDVGSFVVVHFAADRREADEATPVSIRSACPTTRVM